MSLILSEQSFDSTNLWSVDKISIRFQLFGFLGFVFLLTKLCFGVHYCALIDCDIDCGGTLSTTNLVPLREADLRKGAKKP